MKVGLCTIAFREKSLTEAIDIAADCGYEAVEVWCKPPHDPGGFDEAYWTGIAEQMAARNLAMPVIGSYLRGTKEDFDEQADRILKIADALDSTLIRVWAGTKGSKDASETDWDAVVAAYGRLAEKATGHRFCFERHGGTLTDLWDAATKLLDRLPQPNMGLNYQFYGSETTDAVCHSLVEAKDRLLNFHVQNAKHVDSKRQPADAESGDLDYTAIVATLKEIGYSGYLETEFVRDGVGEAKSIEAKVAAAARECGYLKKLIAN